MTSKERQVTFTHDCVHKSLSFYALLSETLILTALLLVGFMTKVSAQSTNCVTKPSGLVSWWPGEGNAADVVGGNTGTPYGGVVFTSGVVGEAFSFNGINGHVRIADRPSLHFTNALTLEAWINPRNGTGGNIIGKWDAVVGPSQMAYAMSLGVGGSGWLGVGVNADGTPGGMVNVYANMSGTNIALPVGQWTHVAATYDGTALRIYANGVLRGQVAYTRGIFPGTNDLAIGGVVGGVTPGQVLGPFAGMIDEPAVYNRALSATEIQQLYAIGSQPCIPHGAKANATVVNGFVVAINITDFGFGYTNAPLVEIRGGGGSGAAAVATVSNGFVTGITITDAGIGYTNTPKVVIASPPLMPWLEIAVSKVKVTQHLILGRNYVFESSIDTKIWTQIGTQFTAQEEIITQESDVDETGRYFRIREVP
jgi:hypothetical protein